MYIPLGGKNRRIFNSFLIFSFVAYWHDPEGSLLSWGWLITIFIVPEIALTRFFCTEEMRTKLGDWHLHLCAFAGALNILTMMSANLIGFAVGVDGFLQLIDGLLNWKGLAIVTALIFSLFGGVHRIFYYHRTK
jgi:D-alanyl-lipoteichoic acid acyltransferase DltB (MBOAT superfamily)